MNNSRKDAVEEKPSYQAAPTLNLSANVTTAQGAAALVDFLLSGSVGSADAINTAQAALVASGTLDKTVGGVGAAAGVTSIGASSAQMFQQFAADSAKAGALAGKIAGGAGILAIGAAGASIGLTVVEQGPEKVTVSQLGNLAAATLAFGAQKAPLGVGVALGALASGLTVYSLTDHANKTTVSDLFAQIKQITRDYYAKLTSDDQASFSATLKSAIQGTFDGGMMVPRLDTSGQIASYAIEIPASIAPQPDGSQVYTFASGITLAQNSLSQSGTLNSASTNGRQDVWTIPQPGKSANATLVVYKDKSFSDVFKDEQGHVIAATTIEGSNGNYSVLGSGNFQFITVAGINNQVTAAAGSYMHLKGSGDTANVSGGTVLVNSTGTVSGNGNLVQGASNSRTAVYGTGNTVDLIAGSGSVAQFFTANSANRVNGTGNGIGVWATGETIESSGNTISFSAGGMSSQIYGNFNYVWGLSSSDTAVYGTGNTVDLVSGSGAVARFFTAGAANRVNGTGNNIGVWASGELIESSGNNIHFSAGGMSSQIYGNFNYVRGLSSSDTAVYGTGNTVDLVSGSGAVARFFTAGAANRISGTGNNIGVWATGELIESSGNNIHFSAGGMSSQIYGNFNYVRGLSSSDTAVYGTGNTVDLLSGSGAVARFFTAGAANRVNGTGNNIGVWATGELIESSGNNIHFSAGGMSSQIYGNYNYVWGLSSSDTTVYGTGNIVDLVPGSGAVVRFFTAGGANRVNGSGNGIGVWATDETIESTGNNIQFSAGGMNTRIYGDSNHIQAGTGSLTTVSGASNLVDLLSNSGSIARFDQAYSVNRVNGSGNYVDVWATGASIDTSWNTVRFSADGMNTRISGNSNHVLAGAGSITNFNGAGNVVDLLSNTGSIVRFDQANTANKVNGTGNYVDVLATGETVESSENTIRFSTSGLTTSVIGNGNKVQAGKESLTNLNGTNNLVNFDLNSGSSVNLQQSNSSNTFSGWGNTISVSANNVTINASGEVIISSQSGATTTVIGNSNAIAAERGVVNVHGSNNTVGGHNNIINAANNSTLFVDAAESTINASYSTIVLGSGTKGSTIRINGHHNFITSSGGFDQKIGDLNIVGNGDDNVIKTQGIHTGGITGYRNGLYYATTDEHGHPSYGAWGTPPLYFPSFSGLVWTGGDVSLGGTGSGSSSGGGIGSLPGSTPFSPFKYSQVYFSMPIVDSLENEVLNILVVGCGASPCPPERSIYKGPAIHLGVEEAHSPSINALAEPIAIPLDTNVKMPGLSYSDLLHQPGANEIVFNNFVAATKQASASKDASLGAELDALYKAAALDMFASPVNGVNPPAALSDEQFAGALGWQNALWLQPMVYQAELGNH